MKGSHDFATKLERLHDHCGARRNSLPDFNGPQYRAHITGLVRSAMIIGVIAWELEVFGCQSLKEKRSVVKSLKDRLHERFNVSVAETAHHDVWQRAELTACVVSADKRHAESVLASADALVAGEARARVIDTYRTFR